MKVDSFKEFVLDQLSALSELKCRAMFGGYGLYERETFFGIIYQSRIYFKTDSLTRPFYQKNGMKPFQPNIRMTLKNYYEVPVDVIEERERLFDCAVKAIHCQKEKKKKEPKSQS
jgi:DNA transformation protein